MRQLTEKEKQELAEYEARRDEILSDIPDEFRGYFSWKAWEGGHSSGYHEVIIVLQDLLDGFQDALKKYTARVIQGKPQPQKMLKVWWIPQVPGKPFEVGVDSVPEGVKIMHILAQYDLFQYEHNIKPDYCNAGGIVQWDEDSDGEGNPGWVDWYDEDTGEDNPERWLEERGEQV